MPVLKRNHIRAILILTVLSILSILSFQNCAQTRFIASEQGAGTDASGGVVPAAVASVQGVCGFSNRQVMSNAPSADLCAAGVASAISGLGPWTWTCHGSSAAYDVACVTNKIGAPVAVLGDCGSSHNQIVSSAPTSNLCTTGTASAVTGSGPWSWSCQGANGGTHATCSATRPVPIAGRCGISHNQILSSAPTSNLCTAGTASAVTGSGPWSWSCQGVNGGAPESCVAQKQTASAVTCPAIPGVNTAAWTGTVMGYNKSFLVREGTICPASVFSCVNEGGVGVIKLNGATFAVTVANSELNNYTSAAMGCKQVPNLSCSLTYSYSNDGVYVNWSFSNMNQEFINLEASTYSCSIAGVQQVSGPIAKILNSNRAGPVESVSAVNCRISITDVLGQTRTCGGRDSMWCGIKFPPTTDGTVRADWDVGGYSSGSYILKVNDVAQPTQSLPVGGSRDGTNFPVAKYEITATINSSEGIVSCSASTTPSCVGEKPLYNGDIPTGQTRALENHPTLVGQCQCAGGLNYDSATQRCQKSCPMGSHFNDRNGVYTCDNCKDAVVRAFNGASATVIGKFVGSACLYPGLSTLSYTDMNRNTCYINAPFGGWIAGEPTRQHYEQQSYPSSNFDSCQFVNFGVSGAYFLNCTRDVTTNDSICSGATGTNSTSVTGGGIQSSSY